MLGGIGGTELIVIFLVILIFFGANKIPELARGIGQGMNEFRKASDSLKDEIEKGKKGLHSSPPKREEPKKEAKEEVVEGKQEKSTEN
ncbi:MAG: twin-arginine translocase TatA/TatE family subunit [Balneolaceae bacterium]|nr:twin-arginine translocase TatA/TatE family subunit [Balneolaceae bacterium]